MGLAGGLAANGQAGSGGGSSSAVKPLGNLVVPALLNGIGSFGAAAATANRLYGVRCIVPVSGTLHSVSVWVGTSSGNGQAAIYDDSATNRTRLWAGSSTAIPGGTRWVTLGDPALAVTAGQHLDLAVQFDNATVTIGRFTLAAAGVAALPTGFFPAPDGATNQLAWTDDVGSFTLPGSPFAESSMSNPAAGLVPFVMAYVS